MIFFCPVFTAKNCPKCEGTGVTQEEALNMCSSSSSSETSSFQSAVCAMKDVLGDDNSHTITRFCMSAMGFDAETSFPRQNAPCMRGHRGFLLEVPSHAGMFSPRAANPT